MIVSLASNANSLPPGVYSDTVGFTNIVDGAVNAAGWITRVTATISSWWDKWIIDGVGVNGPAILARMLSYPARLLEWG